MKARARLTPTLPTHSSHLHLDCQATPLLTPPACGCPSLQIVGNSRWKPCILLVLQPPILSLPAPQHPQDILKYTFSFLQLEQGGSRPQNRADQREAAATMVPFRLNKPPKDARFPRTHLETGLQPQILISTKEVAALRGRGPGWGEATSQSSNYRVS